MEIEKINEVLDFLTSQLERMLNVPTHPTNNTNIPESK